jgi:Carboxypeptidase regulatory-like domain
MWSCVRLGITIALLASSLPSPAQYELITIERPFHSRDLAGAVVDITGAPVPGATIEDRDATFARVLASTISDANGRFAFPQGKLGTAHYLNVQSKGFDPMHITVVLKGIAKGHVKIQLRVAT